MIADSPKRFIPSEIQIHKIVPKQPLRPSGKQAICVLARKPAVKSPTVSLPYDSNRKKARQLTEANFRKMSVAYRFFRASESARFNHQIG
jgi:hypothetical protein